MKEDSKNRIAGPVRVASSIVNIFRNGSKDVVLKKVV